MSKIEIIKQDITIMDTDAVVNAANEDLRAGGGVCGAIFKAAGHDQLQAVCNRIGHCDTGKAVITPGFDLKARYIIHAVGPIYRNGRAGEAELLASCYKSALAVASDNGCHSIAFPLISSGIFGYPKKEAWEVALSSVKDYLEDDPASDIDVAFCVRSDDMFELGNEVLAGISTERDFTFFWMTGQKNEEFSNWYEAPFVIDGITYPHVEKYMMAKKAFVFHDDEIYKKVMETDDPKTCKALGREVKGFDSSTWDVVKYQIVYEANYAKFTQHEDLKEKLLATGNSIMAEASPYDAVWGIKLSADDPDAKDPSKWQGENLLGKILMQIREDMRSYSSR